MSESFGKIQNRILSDARVKAEDIIKEAEEKARRTIEQAKAQAQKDADEIIARAQLEAGALRRSILSSRIRANRLRVLEEKNRIVQSVLHSVEEKLAGIATSAEFQDALKRFVTEAVEAVGAEQSVVRVGFREASKKHFDEVGKIVPKGTKLVIEEQPIEELGGVVASDSEGKIVYNNSFKARLDRLDTQLLVLISSTIFSE
ncbi:MAG TPA: V-type ATP synthase subunit E family protein [Candidatus Bathyarchaeia archaeon]